MKITYELRQEDFLEAFAAHRKSKTFAKWATRIFIAMAGLVTAVVLVSLLVRPSAETLIADIPFFIVVAIWIVMLWALPRWAARKQFRGQPSAKGSRTLTLDEAGVHWNWDGGSAYTEWKNYVRSVESDNLILLYTSPVSFNIVPKRALTAEELNGMRGTIEQNIRIGRSTAK